MQTDPNIQDLLERARRAGLRLRSRGGRLFISGPKTAEPIAVEVTANQTAVLAALDAEARRAEVEAATLADFKRWWAAKHDARPSAARRCMTRLLKPGHHCNSQKCYSENVGPRFYGAALDHIEFWKTASGRFLAVGHPYSLDSLPALLDWCRRHNLAVTVDEDPSWYSSSTHLVVVHGRHPLAQEARR